MMRLLRSAGMRAAFTVLLSLAAAASPAQTKLDLLAGFDGNVRPETWTPLHVRIVNPGSNTDAKIQVNVRTRDGATQSYAQPVRLRAGSAGQEVTVYYFNPDAGQSVEVLAQLIADGRTVAEKKLDNALPITDTMPVIVGLTQDQSGLNFLGQIELGFEHQTRYDPQAPYRGAPNNSNFGIGNRRNPTRILYPKAVTLPDNPFAYQAVDAVALGDMPLDLLSEDQWNAIVNWVRDGGILFVSGGADINRARSKQLSEILPIEPSAVRTVKALPSLASMYSSAPKLTGSPIIVGNLKSDSMALVREGDTPVISTRRLGTGLVVFTAFDALAPEFRAWAGQEGLWRQIMQRGSRETRLTEVVKSANQPYYGRPWMNAGYYPGNNRALSDALAGIQSTEAPSFTFIGLFLLSYIVCLVPVNYFLLKKRDKKELAWITAPVIIILFSTGAYAVGYKIKGGQLYLNHCSVLEGAANSDGFQAYTVASVFSPRQARYDLFVTDPNALPTEVTETTSAFQRAVGDIVVEREQKTTIKNALVNMWDHRTYDFESHANIGGSVAASVQPTGSQTCNVKITNSTGRPIIDGSVSFRGNSAIIGALQPGESKTVRLNYRNNTMSGVSIITGGMANVSPTAAKIQDSLAGMAQGWQQVNAQGGEVASPFVFTGWFTGQAAGVGLENEQPKEQGVNLLVVHLPAPEGSGASLPRVAAPPVNARTDPFATNPSMMGMGGGNANQLNNLAYTYANQGRLDLALKTAKQALAQAPNSGNILDTVGEMHQRRKEYKQAAVYYARALQMLGTSPETHEKYGETLLALGSKKAAIVQLQTAARDPGQWGVKARAVLSKLGVNTRSSAAPAGSTMLAAGSGIPPVPTTGSGSRQFIQAVLGGGYNVIRQRWNHTGGVSSSSSSSTYVPPGQPLPR